MMHKSQGVQIPPKLRLVGGISPPPPKAKRRTGQDHLTDASIRAAKVRGKLYKLADGAGLNLVIMPTGGKLWRFKYHFAGKERSYSIGPYPEVTIVKARKARAQARDWLRDGLDPNVQKRVEHATVATAQEDTLAKVAEEWLRKKSLKWSKGHQVAQRRLLERFVLPTMGALPITSVEAPQLLQCLTSIEKSGAHELLAKTREILGAIFRYSIVTGRRTTNPADALKGAFVKPPEVNRATVSDKDLPQLFNALAKVPAEPVTKLALYYQIATGVRPVETRFAVWSEIDLKAKQWQIPAKRMKMRSPHLVPLSPLALDILKRAKELRQTGERDELVFGGFGRTGTLSENAVLSLIARAGFFGRQTGHGFRASLSTWAHEKGFDSQAIELCLAHKPPGVKAKYNHALYLDLRQTILTAWAEHLIECGLRLPLFRNN